MEKYLVEGNISVKACILANRRNVYEIIADEKKAKEKDTYFILKQAESRNIPIVKTTREKIDELAEG